MSVASFAAAQVIRALPRVQISRAVGFLCEQRLPSRLSRFATGVYSRAYQVDLAEAESIDREYASFDEFFTRRLRSGARPLSDAAIISPSDGELLSSGPVAPNLRIAVKRQNYEVRELLGDVAEGERYAGGAFAVVYLSPRDYHRVHSPVDGAIPWVRAMDGDLYPVNSIGERYVEGLFVRNKRVVFPIDTADMGRVTVVMVGATIVGKVSCTPVGGRSLSPGKHELPDPYKVEKGDEIGIFHLGSTAVVFVESGVNISRPLGPVLYGETLRR